METEPKSSWQEKVQKMREFLIRNLTEVKPVVADNPPPETYCKVEILP